MTLGKRLYFGLDEYHDRWAALERSMLGRGYETAVVWQRTGGSYDRAGDVWYLTGYASHASGQEPSFGGNAVGRAFAALLIRRGEPPELHIAEPASTVDPELVAVDHLRAHDPNLALGLAQRLAELGLEGPVAYIGDDFLPVQMYRFLTEATPQITWVPEPTLLYDTQRRKSARELELYRAAGVVASRALTKLMDGLVVGKPQSVAAADAAHVVISAGGGVHRVGANFGERAQLTMWDKPLYAYSTDAPKSGDIVRGWIYGPLLEGYWIDPGRTAVCGGRPTDAQRQVIEDSIRLTNAIIDAVRPGTTPREAGIVGDRTTRALGYSYDTGGGIWELYGHGIGTFFASPKIPAHGAEDFVDDRLQWNVDVPFMEGEVYCVETFLTHEDVVGMVGIEEVFIVHADGAERLISTPLTFW